MARPLPPSLYAATARPATPTPPLLRDRRASVAIVGGGFTGLSTALHLAEAGVDTVLLEAHEPGWGASGRNGGQVNPGLKLDPEVVSQRYGEALVALSYAAPDDVFALIARHGIECEAVRGGTYRAAFGTADATELRSLAAQCGERGMPVRLLDAVAMRVATGTGRYRLGMFDPRGGQLNPLGYARGLARAALRAGAAIHGDSPVTSLTRAGAGWALATPGGVVTADRVVLASNGYTGGLWPGLAQSVIPVFSAIVASAPLPPALADSIVEGRGVLYELGEVTFYYRVDPAGRLLIGGRSRSRDLAGPDAFRFLSDYAIRLWPALHGVAWTHGWNGQIAATLDHMPHLHAPAAGVLACLGYNGRGVAMATVMGREIARHLQRAELPMPAVPIDRIGLHRFWKAGVAVRLTYGRIRDHWATRRSIYVGVPSAPASSKAASVESGSVPVDDEPTATSHKRHSGSLADG